MSGWSCPTARADPRRAGGVGDRVIALAVEDSGPIALHRPANRLSQSDSGQQVFSTWPGVENDSAGLSADAEVPAVLEQIASGPTSSLSWRRTTAASSASSFGGI